VSKQEDFIVVQQHPSLISYVDSLQKKNAENLSFYPKVVFEREHEKGRIFLSLLNGEPCGYIYIGAFGRDLRCHQVCIQYDARRRLYASALVNVVEQAALENSSYSIVLRCGFDLEANKFWKMLGYKCVDIQEGGVRRNRKINVWRKQLQPELFEDIHLEPARGETSNKFWLKNKQTGLITQFNRGKSLRDYKALLEGKSV
tara:strand:- start:215 stop:817 length:603 start_codon:yes stop_codon:yes gene_type:complete